MDDCANDYVEAYTNPAPSGLDPGAPNTASITFFCDKAFTLPSRYEDITCATVGDTLSTSMEFLGGTILHEWMHNDALGAQGTGGSHIGDFNPRTFLDPRGQDDPSAGYGPYKSRQLFINHPEQCIVNADNFLWLAYEILWTRACLNSDQKRFNDPAPDNSVATATLASVVISTISGTVSSGVPPTATSVPIDAQPPSTTQAATTTAVPSTTAAPSTTSAAPAVTTSAVAPYAQGTCHIHVKQWDIDGSGLYDLEVTMTDNDGNQIGYTQPLGDDSSVNYVPPSDNDGYSDSNPLSFQSKLEDILGCRPEKHDDYIAFGLGDQAWPSDGDFADGNVPSCTVGGWDGADDPEQYLVCIFRCCERGVGRLMRGNRIDSWIVTLCVLGEVGRLLMGRIESVVDALIDGLLTAALR